VASVLIAVVGGLLALWLALLVALWITQRKEHDQTTLRDTVRILPDLVRLLRRLARDPTLPRGVRIRLLLLLGYLLLPIDLIPDFIPVLGYADDAIIVAIALRSVTRCSGAAALDQHWRGSPNGLRTIKRLAGISDTAPWPTRSNGSPS
jgi:uncharacterized membrane protein YkvA (DUF1232 family)